MDELTGHHQQVIKRQQQRLAQFHDHHFQGRRGGGGLQAVRCVRTIGNAVTAFPTADGVLADA